MTKKQILVVGAGGHARVATEIINAQNHWEVAAYLDENLQTKTLLCKPSYTSLEEVNSNFPNIRDAFVAIGSNLARKKWHINLKKNNYNIPCFRHASAMISDSASIGPGTLISAGAIVGAAAIIGEGVIINTGAILDHDTSVGDFSHISQGVVVCGVARIGDEVLIGPGCVIEKMASVPSSTIISANSVVATPQY
ncbi:MAG: NeuD/PglB/VioB family sugar acetyltransferase [Bdellovibrio sp.]